MTASGPPQPPDVVPRARPSKGVVALLWALRVLVVVLTVVVAWSFAAGLGHPSVLP